MLFGWTGNYGGRAGKYWQPTAGFMTKQGLIRGPSGGSSPKTRNFPQEILARR